MSDISPEILDKLTKVCLCKAIPRSTIKKAIREGARTVEDVNNKVGSGSGGCGGKRCGVKIQELLEQYDRKEWQ